MYASGVYRKQLAHERLEQKATNTHGGIRAHQSTSTHWFWFQDFAVVNSHALYRLGHMLGLLLVEMNANFRMYILQERFLKLAECSRSCGVAQRLLSVANVLGPWTVK